MNPANGTANGPLPLGAPPKIAPLCLIV